jgi:hypothetical protein
MSIERTDHAGHPLKGHRFQVTITVPPPPLPYDAPKDWAVDSAVQDLIAEGAITVEQAVTLYLNRALAAHADTRSSYTVTAHLDAVQALLYPEAVPAPATEPEDQ